MRILIVSQSFYPDNFKINDLIKDFSDDTHDVTVLSGLGDYTTGKVHPNYRFFRNRTESYNGCRIKRVRTLSRRKGPVFRSLNYLSFVFFGSIWAFFTKNQYDLVYVYQPSPATMIFPGIVAAKRNSVPLLIYCLDIWPEAVKAMNIKEDTAAYRWIHKISRIAYNAADFIMVSSKSFMTYLHEENQVPCEKMSYLPQHADRSEVSSLPTINVMKAEVNFLFTGNIGYVQDVETIVKATALLDMATDFRVHIVGGGSNFDACQELATRLGIQKRIHFYGHQPPDTMSAYNEMADACLLTLKNENKIGLTIPAKLQGYMSAGKPIIGAIEGDAKKIIEEAECGICVPASDAEKLSQAMIDFMELDEVDRKRLGDNALAYFSANFEKETFVDATLEKMHQLITKES